MNLLHKAAQFEQLCSQLAKKAQQIANEPFRFKTPVPEASLSAPTPKFQVFKTPETPVASVHDLPSVPPKAPAPTSNMPMEMLGIFSRTLMNFDPSQFDGVSVDAEALKAAGNKLNSAVSNKQAPAILQALSEILGLTRNGGGQLYSMAYKLYNAVKATTQQPKKPADWLSRYMKEQDAADQAESMKNQMQASLDAGPAVQDALNRK